MVVPYVEDVLGEAAVDPARGVESPVARRPLLPRRRAPDTSTALPDSGSTARLVGQQVAVHAGVRGGHAHRACPGASWPQPCGRLTTPGMIASVISTGASTAPARERRRARRAVGQAEARGVVGVHAGRCSGPCPSPAARGCASRSCSSAAGGGRPAPCGRCAAPRAPRAAAARRPRSAPGASSILPDGVRSTSGMRGSSGPRSMPCGLCLEPRQREAVGVVAEARRRRGRCAASGRAIALGPAPRLERGEDLARSRPAMRECAVADLALRPARR